MINSADYICPQCGKSASKFDGGVTKCVGKHGTFFHYCYAVRGDVVTGTCEVRPKRETALRVSRSEKTDKK